jgi:hypothetical protein
MRQGRLPMEHLVGQVARSVDDARGLMRSVVTGNLEPLAAAIDWDAIEDRDGATGAGAEAVAG